MAFTLLILLLTGFSAALVWAKAPQAAPNAALLAKPETVIVVATAISVRTTVPEAATADRYHVCTNAPAGRLHVRFAPGESSEIRGFLAEGETVEPVLNADEKMNVQAFQGGVWLQLQFPMSGWVNSKYICSEEGD